MIDNRGQQRERAMQIEKACSGKTRGKIKNRYRIYGADTSGLYPQSPGLIPVSVALNDKECFCTPVTISTLVFWFFQPSHQEIQPALEPKELSSESSTYPWGIPEKG